MSEYVVETVKCFYLKAITVKCYEAADYDGLLVGESLCLALRLRHHRVQLEVRAHMLGPGTFNTNYTITINIDNLHPAHITHYNNYHYDYYY